MKISFYPVDIQYRIIDGKALIYLFGRTVDGAQICCIDEDFEPYFYVLPKDLSIKDKILQVKETKNNKDYYVKDIELVKKKYLGKEKQVLLIWYFFALLQQCREYLE